MLTAISISHKCQTPVFMSAAPLFPAPANACICPLRIGYPCVLASGSISIASCAAGSWGSNCILNRFYREALTDFADKN